MDDLTVEPILSEKHCKREFSNIVIFQMISRDTPFWRCQAYLKSVLPGSDFEYKDYQLSGLSSPVLGEVQVGDKGKDSQVRVENRAVGIADEIVSLRFLV